MTTIGALLVTCVTKDAAIAKLCEDVPNADRRQEIYRAWCARRGVSVYRSDLERLAAARSREFQRPLFD